MKNTLIISCLVAGAIFLQFCSSGRTVAASKADAKEVPVSYEADVAPIMVDRCTPCHFPDGGKKKFLDTYAAVSNNIDDIIFRVELPQDSARFMPFKNKKEPLSDSMIAVLKTWRQTGMAK